MATNGKGGGKDTFGRKIFRASRLADFATEDELIKQTGQPVVPKGRDRSCVRRCKTRAVHADARPDRSVLGRVAMIRIAISEAAYDAIASMLPGEVGYGTR